MNFFDAACHMLQEWRFQFSLFIAEQQPLLTKNFCKRYEEELEKSGFFNITAADPVFSSLPGIYCICIKDTLKGTLVGGGRLHLKMPHVPLPLERIDTPLIHPVKEYIFLQAQKNLISELSGFWVDRNNRRPPFSTINTIQIIICLILGLGLHLECKKSFCLSSRHIYQHATTSGFRTNSELAQEGKIDFPPGQYSYFMEWDPLVVSKYIEQDILKLIYWARDNLSLRMPIISTAKNKNLTFMF